MQSGKLVVQLECKIRRNLIFPYTPGQETPQQGKGLHLHVLPDRKFMMFLVPGYAFAISISFVVPKLFTAIAFDAGGVASGPMTATFLLPLAQGACVAVGGNIVTDAFGVVAMVAMTPLITVQMMGLVAQLRTRKAQTAQPAAVLATVFADLPDDAIIEL